MTYCHKGALATQRGIDGHKPARRFQELTLSQPSVPSKTLLPMMPANTKMVTIRSGGTGEEGTFFSDLVEELKTEVSENPIPTGKVQKRHVAYFMCVLHLSTFSRSTIWQEAFQQEPRLTKTQIMGQSSILMGKERLCYHFLLWLGRYGHTHLQSQDSGGLERWRSSWATQWDETILYPRMACWGKSQTYFPTWQWVVILKLWHFPLLFSSHMLPHQRLLENHSTYKTREH